MPFLFHHNYQTSSFLLEQIYKSPQVDMGYDIADYKLIDPCYGTNDDVDVRIAELKKTRYEAHDGSCREPHIGSGILNLPQTLVPPITPLLIHANILYYQHDWFKSSISSPKSPKRDWYIRGMYGASFPILPPEDMTVSMDGRSGHRGANAVWRSRGEILQVLRYLKFANVSMLSG